MADETTQTDPNEGKHAPKPETIDQTKSAVTAEAAQKFADAAPQPNTGEGGEKNGEDHHSSKPKAKK